MTLFKMVFIYLQLFDIFSSSYVDFVANFISSLALVIYLRRLKYNLLVYTLSL